jgi:hypothetical protein
VAAAPSSARARIERPSDLLIIEAPSEPDVQSRPKVPSRPRLENASEPRIQIDVVELDDHSPGHAGMTLPPPTVSSPAVAIANVQAPAFPDGGFIDLGKQIEAELEAGLDLKVSTSFDAGIGPASAPPTLGPGESGLHAAFAGVNGELPDQAATFDEVGPLKAFAGLAVGRESGLWLVESGMVTKEIYLTDGVPVYVSSNMARELFGEYLVSQAAISEAELAMALAMMPRFGGKLGDTLVGLGLMRPIEVFRHLTRQVREKLLDVFAWESGLFRFYRGRSPQKEMFPLGLDAFELMGAASRTLSDRQLGSYLEVHADNRPRAVRPAKFPPERFRLGAGPRELYERLDGRRTVSEWRQQYTTDVDRAEFGRTLFVLVETELALTS